MTMAEGNLAGRPALQPLRSAPTLSEEAATQLRERILAGHMRLGERLVEAQLARDLGVSRGTVREALAQLRAEHLVEEIPRRGTFVTDIGERDVEDLFDLRSGLETTAVRLALKRDADGLAGDLDALVKQMRAAAEAADHDALARLDFEFHAAICQRSGNARLIGVFRTHTSLLRVLIALEEREYYPDPSNVVREHREIVDAVRGGDLASVQAQIVSHLDDAKARLMELTRSRDSTSPAGAPAAAAGAPRPVQRPAVSRQQPEP
jgi:DNA-binding GntR family transcriptional regulator